MEYGTSLKKLLFRGCTELELNLDTGGDKLLSFPTSLRVGGSEMDDIWGLSYRVGVNETEVVDMRPGLPSGLNEKVGCCLTGGGS